MQRPRRGGEGVLELFGEEEHAQSTPDLFPQCIYCGRPTRRTDAAGRPAHEPCEPRDVGLTDPQTSRSAARKARKGPGSPLARKVHELLVQVWPDGMTDDELAAALPDESPGSISKRRLDLCRAGRVETLHVGLTRPTRWGREATVWFASFPEDPL